MTHFNLNRMLQGCSAFIQTMAGDRAARNDAKRVNNHVLPLTCPLLASSLRLTCPLQLRRIALILCVLVMSVGQMWGGEVTYARSACSFGSDNLVYITNEGDRDDNISSVTITNRSNDNTGFKVTGKTGANSIVTITPASGITLTQVVFTFNAAVNTSNVNMYDGNTTSSTPLTSNQGKTTFTWEGSSTAAKAFGYLNASGTSNNYGLITSITITYSGGGSTSTHTVTAATEDEDKGTAAAGSATVVEGATTTITATPKSGYKFDHWTVSGTGATLSSTTTNPTTLTMGTANATVTAYFAEKSCPSSGTLYTLTMKNATLSSVTQNTEVALATTYATESGGTAYLGNKNSDGGKAQVSTTGSGSVFFNGNDAYIKVDLDCPLATGDIITFTLGSGTKEICFTTDKTRATTYKTSSQSYTCDAAFNEVSTIYIWRVDGGTYLHSLTISRPAACTAPNHVDVSGRWDRFAGETISLTATAYSSEGTGSPIAAANITGYQWEKLVGTTWTALSNGTTDGVTTSGATTANLQIANCKATNSGKYRCVVSTGTTCSTASATATDGTQGLGVKVFMLECYNDGTKTCSFTRTGDTQTGTATLTLAANTAYTFKFHVDNVYYGNNASINEDITNYVFCNSDNGGNCAVNFTVNSGLGGTFTFSMEYSTGGNSSVLGEPELSVTYPRKRIYLDPGVWKTPSEGEKFAYNYYRDGGSGGWTDFLTEDDCGMFADIPQWKDVILIPVRLKNTTVSPGSWDDRWNQTNNITVTSNDYVTITGWNASDFTYTAYSTPTYTISYNAGTGGSGSKSNETKTCGVDFTLPGSTFTYAGHSQDGWATADGGAIAYALSGSYTTNDDEEFFPHWKCNTPTITDNGDNTVTITVPSGTTVRYTTDGSTPTSSSGTIYSSAIDIAANVTVKAIAYQSNCTDSEVASQACTYHAPAATAMVTWNLNVGTSATTTIFDSGDSDDHTNIPVANITVDQTNAGADGAGQNYRTTKLAIKTGANGADWSGDPTNYVLFTFKVGCGKKLTPSKISIPVANVGSASANNIKYKAVLSDTYGHSLSGTYVVTTQNGTVESFEINNSDATKYFQGVVTLKLWAWTIANTSNGGSAFRMGTPVEIYGAIGNQATPAATITWTTQPANGTVGDADFAYAVSCSDGSAVTVISANTTYATIVGGKLHYAAAGTTHLVATATDACGNEVVQNSSDFTVSAAGPAGDCDLYFWFNAAADATTAGVTNNEGSFFGSLPSSSANSVTGSIVIDGTTYNVTQRTSNTTPSITFTVPSGKTGKLYAIVNGSSNRSVILKQGSTTIQSITWENSCAGHDFDAVSAGTYTITSSGNMGWCMLAVKVCDALTPCTTPVIPTLSNQSLCEGADIDAWNATVTNASAISTADETVTYSWKKKGNATELANTASFDLGASAAESQAGTYVVTVTVSKTGYASATATKEVTLTVNEATEVTAITADKATVYPTNSVTLTATANMDATWQWYTCTNAEGDGEDIISEETSAAYAFTAPASAGTYYYKVKATGSCGADEMVYTLTVSAAAGGDCFHYVSVLPDKDISPSSGASIVTPTHATTLEGGTMKVGSQQITITKNGLKLESSKSVSITLDAALEAGNVVIVKGTTATAGYGVTINGVNFYEADSKTFDVSYTVVADDGLEGKTALTVTKYSGSSYLQEIKITGCGEACTDPEVTASVNNSTACVGTSVTFTATGAHAEATYQWQKYSGGAWTDITDAKAATYNIASVATTDALKYRVIATNDCNRTSNEVTLNVPVAPVFADFTATRSVMATLALSITDVEASDATSYAWYKSADATYDAGTDTKVGTTQELLLASGGEAAGATYYLFCVASNACGSTTSGAITVNVTTYVEEECATRDQMSSADYGFDYGSAGQGDYSSTKCWTMNSNSKILTYTAPDGKYFKTAKVTIASSSASKASYNWSTNGGSTYTAVALTVNSTLTERTINLAAHGNVNSLQIGRNFDSKGESSGTLYVSKICFEYTESCTATTVTVSGTGSETHTIGSSFTEPTCTLTAAAVAAGGTLVYSSSDEDIATVDSETGEVEFHDRAGTVIITASYAGDGTYCASEGSYTITVSCSDEAPKIVAAGSVNMSGCNSSVALNAKKQDGETDFTGGSYQWFRNGEEIEGATGKSYTASQTGVYTVAYTSAGGCTSPSTNSATITSETVEPEVTKLVPFHYYHVDKTYTAQMKDRHLFSVKGSEAYGSTGKNFKLTMSRNGGEAVDMTTAASIFVTKSGDGQVDTVMIDLNKLSGKYSVGDELVLTCAAVNCSGNVSAVYKDEITINVIGATPTLALICSGTDIAAGTRDTKKLTVGGDFLTGYNVADLCQQTGDKSFDANTEWGLYTRLKENYIVTPVNGYAVFNKLNYEPFDILLLTDYPKASKSDAAKTVLDDMADLCDYRPMLSFKTHMVAKSPSKWAAKGFTTSATENKADGKLNLNIVCYAHPMFESIKEGENVYDDVANSSAPLVYTMLTDVGHEGKKGMQGFELAAAENFVTIGLTHYNATITKDSPNAGEVEWTPGTEDRMLVTVAERQTNIEARFILFSLNCGAQSMLTEKGRTVVLKCLEYLLDVNPLHVADCSFTFDNGDSNEHDASWYSSNCPSCTGTKGDGKWSTAANWGPDYRLLPGEFTSVRIKKPVEVDIPNAHVMDARIIEEGQITIPASKALEVKSTIRRMEGTEIYPTEANDIVIGSSAEGNGTLIFNNNAGDTKARVDMYSNAQAADPNTENSATNSVWQYIGTPHTDVANARSNYYGSWLYQYVGGTWTVIPNGGPLVAFRGYCITNETAPIVYDMAGTLAATTTQDIAIPTGYTVIANSWVAPIDINAITDDDMEGISDKTIYFFNTGTDAEGDNGTGTAAGTYRATPIHSASYTGDWQIPSMQGFYVSTTSAGTFHLDYERHVRPAGGRTIVSNPMYAPRRAKAAEEEPAVLKIFARGSRYQDKLIVLEREDFTRGYDSGWDGEAWGGSDLSPMVYVTGEGREDAVSAIPEFEGTVIAFKAGEDEAYTLHFEYLNSDEPLYLFDTENNTYTQIMTGNAYYFTTSDKAPHSRFILTRKAPQIATGTELTSDGESAKARKLLIEDKMYILLNGMLYDATGKVVK